MYHQPEEAAYIVMACAVLHNICLYVGEPAPEPDGDTPDGSLEGAEGTDGESRGGAPSLAQASDVARNIMRGRAIRQAQVERLERPRQQRRHRQRRHD